MIELSRKDENGFNQIFVPIGTTPTRTRRRNDWFLGQIGSSGRVLEIGCGVGDTAAYIAARTKAEVVAVDISDMFISEARSKHFLSNLSFERVDLLNDNLSSLGSFDIVIGNGILHHLVVRLDDVLCVLRGLTKNGGKLAFIEPNFWNPYCAFIFGTPLGRRLAKLEPDEMAFGASQLGRHLDAAGWKDVKVATRDFLVPGLPTWTTKPITLVEPLLEATPLTSWLAQSHFVSANT